MKILQLTVHYHPNIGGVESHLTDLVDKLIKNHEVVVLTYRPLSTKAPWKMYEKQKQLTIIRLPWIPGLFYKLNSHPLLQFLYILPGLLVCLPVVILRYKPQVIHAHGLISGLVAVLWKKIFKTRVVISTHSMYSFPKSGMYHNIAKSIFSSADKVLCLSNQSVNEIKKLGVPSINISRFTYWINLDMFKPREELELKKKLNVEKKFVVLFVGRLVEEKGVHELLEAEQYLDKNTTIIIAGAGPLEEEITKKFKGIFLGKQSQVQLSSLYNVADVLIVPSTHEEGFGRVILESLASGTPVIGSNRGAIPEAIDSTVGILINVNTHNILTAVNTLVKSKSLVRSLSKNCRKFALEKYSAKNIQEITKTYTI